jgi:hypothetical protein
MDEAARKLLSDFMATLHSSASYGGLGYVERARELEAQVLAAMRKAGGVPEGWVLVPKVPTDKMVRAAEKAYWEQPGEYEDDTLARFAIVAAVAAAPQPPALDSDGIIEACAKVAEDQYHPTTLYYGERQACLMVAAAIRAMKVQK